MWFQATGQPDDFTRSNLNPEAFRNGTLTLLRRRDSCAFALALPFCILNPEL
jgi:hypothetical protein